MKRILSLEPWNGKHTALFGWGTPTTEPRSYP